MFDEVLLTAREKCVLFKMRFNKKSTLKDADEKYFLRLELIDPNYTGKKNSIGEPIPDGTYRLADKYIRYRIYMRQDFYRRLVTPITVSVLTTLAVQLVTQWLWPLIKQLLR